MRRQAAPFQQWIKFAFNSVRRMDLSLSFISFDYISFPMYPRCIQDLSTSVQAFNLQPFYPTPTYAGNARWRTRYIDLQQKINALWIRQHLKSV